MEIDAIARRTQSNENDEALCHQSLETTSRAFIFVLYYNETPPVSSTTNPRGNCTLQEKCRACTPKSQSSRRRRDPKSLHCGTL
jgi:hypothetical protein